MSEPFFSASWYRVAPLRPRLHQHVAVHRHRYRGHTWYVLQDHATGRVHRFTPATYLLVGNMDGARTLDEIWKATAIQLDDAAPSQDDVVRLMAQLHAADLLQADGPPETFELLERLSKQRWRLLGRRFKNPVAISIPAIDPDRMLGRLAAWLRPIGPGVTAALWLALVIPAAVLLALYASELTDNLPDRVLAADNLLLIVLVFPVIKALHELGHGLAVKLGGGAVHEAGLMLLVLIPVPYVDATASLAFRSKWRRALVGAAGMLVEVAVAAVATYVWVAAEQGIVKAMAFDVILVAGLSTVLVNGNPLLRFDGYYILSDLIEIPNLGGRSNRLWASLIERRLFGVQPVRRDTVLPSERPWLLAYGPAAFVYRTVAFFGIALFLATEYLFIGVLIALWSVVLAFVWPIVRMARHVLTSPSLGEKRPRAVAISALGLALAAALLLAVPAPLTTTGEGVVWLPEDAHVRAGTSSFLQRFEVSSGQRVRQGETLAVFKAAELAAQMAAQEARLVEVETRLRAEEVADRPKALLTRREYEAERAEHARLDERVRRLVARSPRDGTFFALNATDMPGRWAPEGTAVGYVLTDDPRWIRAVVRQDNIDLVRHRLLAISVLVPDGRAATYGATIAREVPAARNELPSRALGTGGGGRLASDPRDNEGKAVLERVFQFDLDLQPAPTDLAYGSRVYLRFSHAWEPLGFQWYRRLRQLFLSHFDA